MSNGLKPFLSRLAEGARLSEQEANDAFSLMMEGEATPSQIGALLMALRLRGETVEEITGAVRAMRTKMIPIRAPAQAIDVCGTGGDKAGTLNISTPVAFILAACGVPVAKHGNRAASSRSGAADVLGALNVNVEADFMVLEQALGTIGTAFLWAQRHHSAMRHVAPTRTELGMRTIFNIMGPLSNPASVKRQLTGVFAREWMEPMARVLRSLGCERAWLVHGEDGLDELTITGASHVCALENGSIRSFIVTPEEAGIQRASIEEIKGGDPDYNAQAIHALFNGQRGPYRDIVLLNTAAALLIADQATDLRNGIALASKAIDSGAAQQKLEQLIALTNSVAPVPQEV